MKYNYDSNVKATHIVDENTWVLSVIRNMKINNPESTYLILEGVTEEEKAVIYKYELCMYEKNNFYASINIQEIKGTAEEIKEWYKKNILKYDLNNKKNIKSLTIDIDKEKAESLQKSIQADKDNEGKSGQMRYEPEEVEVKRSFLSCLKPKVKEYIGYDWIRNTLEKLHDERLSLPSDYADFMNNLLSGSRQR